MKKWYSVQFEYDEVIDGERVTFDGWVETMAQNSLAAELEMNEALFVEMDGETKITDMDNSTQKPTFSKIISVHEFEWKNERTEKQKRALYDATTSFDQYFKIFGSF